MHLYDKKKRLILVRHGKSSWEFNVGDIDRPLKQRGINDATLIAENFKAKNYAINAVYSSTANRAYSTCKIFKAIFSWTDDDITIKDELYDFSGEKLIRFIAGLNNDLNTVIIFGHNHAFTSIANIYGDQYIENVPTSGLVVLKFDVSSWANAKYGQTELVMFPRDYRP